MISILSYLYHKEEGANQHNIQFFAVPGHTQEGGRFKMLLEELCKLERIHEVDMSHVTQGRIIYKITDKGKETMEHVRNPLVKELLGFGDVDI
jgi:hypothetical protein